MTVTTTRGVMVTVTLSWVKCSRLAAEKAGVGQTIAAVRCGGKSGLLRTGRQVTPGRREPMESATENIPPIIVRDDR